MGARDPKPVAPWLPLSSSQRRDAHGKTRSHPLSDCQPTNNHSACLLLLMRFSTAPASRRTFAARCRPMTSRFGLTAIDAELHHVDSTSYFGLSALSVARKTAPTLPHPPMLLLSFISTLNPHSGRYLANSRMFSWTAFRIRVHRMDQMVGWLFGLSAISGMSNQFPLSLVLSKRTRNQDCLRL